MAASSVGVAPIGHAGAMTDEEVLAQAAEEGFELEKRACQDAWGRGDDQRWPCYLERRQAIS